MGRRPAAATPRIEWFSSRVRAKSLLCGLRYLLCDLRDDRLEAQPWVLRDGPERIESGWWDGADVRRDYFIAENPRGETVWIYRDHRYGIDDGEWYLHGVFA